MATQPRIIYVDARRKIHKVGQFAPKERVETMAEEKNGAQGRNRTTDTAIFNRMLYQLSYLGPEPA